MLIRELFTIPAVIPHRSGNSIRSSTTSVPFSIPFFNFKPNKVSVRLQTICHAKPSLNPKDEGELGTERTQFPFEGIVGEEGEMEGGNSGLDLGFGGIGREGDYDKDPEFAEILTSCFKDPQKGRARVEERIKKKRNKMLHMRTGSDTPMKVTFNKFDFSNSYIWFEFNNAPLPKDVTLICDALRCWHIIGHLGGYNSANMQLSEGQMDKKTPTYNEVAGANVNPATFYNIGNFEVQDNLARVWVDIGIVEPLIFDVLINALVTISSDHVGIKQVVFGGSQFENWKENFNVEEAGCSVHKI